MDTLKERSLNLKEIDALKPFAGEIYTFNGVFIDMAGCGSNHYQMFKHIANQLSKVIENLRKELDDHERHHDYEISTEQVRIIINNESMFIPIDPLADEDDPRTRGLNNGI